MTFKQKMAMASYEIVLSERKKLSEKEAAKKALPFRIKGKCHHHCWESCHYCFCGYLITKTTLLDDYL